MTLFEYMSVAFSLVLALTFAEGLRGLHSAFMPDRRYEVHVAWLLIKLFNPITFWWGMWGLRDVTEYWNFGTYFGAMLVPAVRLVHPPFDKLRQQFATRRVAPKPAGS